MNTLSLHPVDIALIVLYAIATIVIGWRTKRIAASESDEFLLAGRRLTLPMFVATLVATWYGGILGIGEFSFRYGLSNWIVFGAPYYVFGLFFALFLAKRIRATNFITIPDKLEAVYDKKTALLGATLTFFLVSPAPYILMIGFLVQVFFGLSLIPSIVLATLVSTIYLLVEGFHSNLRTNIFQFVLMYLGFVVIVAFAVGQYGGLSFIQSHVPPLHMTWHGGNSIQYILVWFFIALWTLVDPSFHQRCYAAQNGTTAQRGILVSILFWFFFDFLTTTTGLYARALLPGLENPALSFPLLAEKILPVAAKGIFLIALLATIMSTLSSFTLIAGITIGTDIWTRILPTADQHLIKKRTQFGIVAAGIFSIVLAIAIPSVVNLWYAIGTTIIPGLLVPVLASYFPSLTISNRYAFTAMVAGWLVSTASLIYGRIGGDATPQYFLGLEPMYPGLFVSVMVWGIGRASISRVKARRYNL
jgi:SSS family solute:Na+ symporter